MSAALKPARPARTAAVMVPATPNAVRMAGELSIENFSTCLARSANLIEGLLLVVGHGVQIGGTLGRRVAEPVDDEREEDGAEDEEADDASDPEGPHEHN